jgi:hypothetical protein
MSRSIRAWAAEIRPMTVNVWASLLLTRCRNLVGARAILSPCWIFQLVEYFAAGLFVVRDWKYGWVPYTFFTVQIFTKFSHGVQSKHVYTFKLSSKKCHCNVRM